MRYQITALIIIFIFYFIYLLNVFSKKKKYPYKPDDTGTKRNLTPPYRSASLHNHYCNHSSRAVLYFS